MWINRDGSEKQTTGYSGGGGLGAVLIIVLVLVFWRADADLLRGQVIGNISAHGEFGLRGVCAAEGLGTSGHELHRPHARPAS